MSGYREEFWLGGEDTYRLIVDIAEEGIWVLDPSDRIVFANKKLLAMLGYPKEELLGHTIYDIVAPEDRDIVREALCRRRRGETGNYQLRLAKRDGTPVWVIAAGAPVMDKRGEYMGVVGLGSDITQLKRAEEALRESEEKYRFLVENSKDVIWKIDLQGRWTFVSSNVEKVNGYRPDEMVGKPVWDFIAPECHEFIREKLLKRMRGEDIVPYIIWSINKDGRRIPIEVATTPITDESGNIVGVEGVSRDITGRMRAEAELKRVNRAIRAISKCNAVVIRAKGESALLYEVCRLIVEDGGYRMAWIGYTANDGNKSIKPMAKAGFETDYVEKARITWADTERGRGPAGTAVRTGKPSVTKHVTTDPDFAPWRDAAIEMGYNSVIGLPLLADGRAFGVLTIYSEKPDAFDREEIALLQDMTDNVTHGILSIRDRIRREEAEEALKAAKNDAELYVDLMGHDINNMNQAALGYLEMADNVLKSGGKLGENNIELIERPMASLYSSSELIDKVTKLRKLKAGELRVGRVDICKVLARVKDRYSHLEGRDITINYHPPAECFAMANELIDELFTNLVENSLKHSREDKPLAIDILQTTIYEEGKEYFMTSIEDNGPGISDEVKKKLFARFSRGETRAKGKGLGLYLVKALVDSFNGRIWVEDRVPGNHTKGTRFVVMLPAAEQ